MKLDLKINKSMRGYDAGRTITIDADKHGLPLDKFWRRRLKDSVIDNCVEVVKTSKSTKGKDK